MPDQVHGEAIPQMQPAPKPLLSKRLIRVGIHAWAIIGIFIVAYVVFVLGSHVSLVIIPLVIALFPAALLSPIAQWLKRKGARPGLAAIVVLLGFLAALIGSIVLLGTLIAGELGEVFESFREAYFDIRMWAEDTFNASLPAFDDLLDQVEEWATGDDGLQAGAGSAATTAIETISALLLGVLALFFYLKDGERIGAFLVRLAPERQRATITEVGDRVWYTLGAYFRGQIIVAAVDAFFIGLGLVILQVPLALPLAALVFLGGLFPVVGAFVAGSAAVLIALADRGLGVALLVLGLNVLVQQAEGNLLEPLIVGRATKLHPLVVLVALTAGALTYGILGAFLAVPLAASAVRAIGYFVEQHRDMDVDNKEDEDPPKGDDRAAVPGDGDDPQQDPDDTDDPPGAHSLDRG